jgi:hypothetical protein
MLLNNNKDCREPELDTGAACAYVIIFAALGWLCASVILPSVAGIMETGLLCKFLVGGLLVVQSGRAAGVENRGDPRTMP